MWERRAPDGFPAERGERAGRWAAWSAAAGPARVRPALAVRICVLPVCAGKEGMQAVRDTVWERRAPDRFSAEGGAARRAMDGMERDGGACARYCTPR